MSEPDWNEHYITGELPWDTQEPDPHLVDLVRAGTIQPGRALEIGSGTGTNALWLAAQGFEVTALDVSARAIEMAQAKGAGAPGRFSFLVLDFLKDDPPGAPFDFVFDRGVFHVFDEADDRIRFASRVASMLHPQGSWVSLIGSTEGPERDHGPPRRSARDIANAIEPALHITRLQSTWFDADIPTRARAWLCIAQPRPVPAQPSSRRP